MLSEHLKEQTLSHHQQLEKLLVGKIKNVANPQDYISLLQLFFSYFGGLEERINLFISEQQLPDHDERRKTTALAGDLEALGAQPAAKAKGDDLPEIENAAAAFGALYVIEGSTLGGSIISKMISARTGLQKGLSFFNGYGDNAMQMWGIFKATLNKLPPQQEADIVNAANATFLKFEEFIRKGDALSEL